MNSRVALTALCLSSILFSGCTTSSEPLVNQADNQVLGSQTIETAEEVELDEIQEELMNLEITEEDFSDL